MRPLDRKLFRDLTSHSGVLLAIAGVMAVGLACFVGMQNAHRTLIHARDDYYARCRMADFWIRVEKASHSQVARAAKTPGVAELYGRISLPVLVDFDDGSSTVNGLLVSAPDERTRTVNDLIVMRGDYFSDPSRNEAIVTEKFAEAHRLTPGSSVTLSVNRRRERFVVVGTAVSSEFAFLVGPGALIPDPASYGAFYVRRSLAERLGNLEGASNEIVGTLVRGRDGSLDDDTIRATLAALETNLDDAGATNVVPLARQASNEILTGDLQGIGSMAAVVPTVFLAVGTLLLNVFLQRMVRNQRTIVGTLKAVGYSDAALFAHYLKFGLIVGAAATAAGVALGLSMAYGLALVFDTYYQFPSLPFETNVGLLAGATALGLGAAASGALLAAYRAMKLAPATAMRPATPTVFRGEGIAGWRIWRALPLQVRIGVRNALRSPGRGAVGVFASAMGAALLVCGLMLTSSQDYLVDVAFHRQERFDLEVVLKDVGSAADLETLRRLPGVERAEPKLDVAVEFLGRETREGAITGLSEGATLTRLYDAQGQEFRPPEQGLVLSSRLAEILGAKVGQTVRFRTLQGERREYVMPVAGVTETFLGVAAYARIDSLAQVLSTEPHFTRVQLSIPANRQVETSRELAKIPGVESTVDRRRIATLLRETMLQNQSVFVVVLIGFAGTIFFGGSLNAALVNLEERRRETATWRALGYDTREIGFQFFVESATVQAIGLVLGMPLGYLLTVLAAEGAQTDVIRLPILFEPTRIAWALVAATAFTLLSHAIVHRRIARMDLLESLKIRE